MATIPKVEGFNSTNFNFQEAIASLTLQEDWGFPLAITGIFLIFVMIIAGLVYLRKAVAVEKSLESFFSVKVRMYDIHSGTFAFTLGALIAACLLAWLAGVKTKLLFTGQEQMDMLSSAGASEFKLLMSIIWLFSALVYVLVTAIYLGASIGVESIGVEPTPSISEVELSICQFFGGVVTLSVLALAGGYEFSWLQAMSRLYLSLKKDG